MFLDPSTILRKLSKMRPGENLQKWSFLVWLDLGLLLVKSNQDPLQD